jgi:hypothetical protein
MSFQSLQRIGGAGEDIAAWFLISSQKISNRTHKEELHKLLFFAIMIKLVL